MPDWRCDLESHIRHLFPPADPKGSRGALGKSFKQTCSEREPSSMQSPAAVTERCSTRKPKTSHWPSFSPSSTWKNSHYPGGKSTTFPQGQWGSHTCSLVFGWWKRVRFLPSVAFTPMLIISWLFCGVHSLLHLLPGCAALEKQEHREKSKRKKITIFSPVFPLLGYGDIFQYFAFNKSPSFTGSFLWNRAIHNEVKKGMWIQIFWPNAYPSICAVSSHAILQGQIAMGKKEIILSQKRRDLN